LKEKKSILYTPLYPYLIALAPVVSLYMLNTMELNVFDLIRPALVGFVVAAVAVLVSMMLGKSIQHAAIIACVLIVSILTYEFAFRPIEARSGLENTEQFFLVAWLAITGAICIILARNLPQKEGSLDHVTLVFNSFGIALFILPLLPAMFDRLTSHPSTGGPSDFSAIEFPMNQEWNRPTDSQQERGRHPDVYYIVMDGYARGDVLQSRFDFDNANFIDWLETKGFFVGELSHSNYAWTHLSLAATLNGEYLQTLLPMEELEAYAPTEKRSRTQFFVSALGQKFVQNSRVHNFLSSSGFRIIGNNSGYAVTRKPSTSPVEALFGEINEFEQSLLSSTIFKPLFSKQKKVKPYWLNHHDKVVHSLKQFGASVDQAGPKFVFYHIVSPHPPYCFDADGGMKKSHPVFDASAWVQDKVVLPGYQDFALENYPDNVAGLNLYLKKAISEILKGTGGNAVVIVQSDHGSSLRLDPYSLDNTDVMERFGILNAIFIPAGFPREGLEKTISSVNTFRVVLRNVFDVDLRPLENRAYYSAGDLDFEEVTHRLLDPPPSFH
jgi:hypothetical protein